MRDSTYEHSFCADLGGNISLWVAGCGRQGDPITLTNTFVDVPTSPEKYMCVDPVTDR